MSKKTKTKPYYVPVAIQKLVTFTIAGLFMLQTILIAWSTFEQLLEGSDYRPQLGFLAIYNLLPIVVFTAAYFLNPRKLNNLSRLFESMLISVAGLLGWSMGNMIVPAFLLGYLDADIRLFEYYWSTLFMIAFITTLYMLRKSGKWQ